MGFVPQRKDLPVPAFCQCMVYVANVKVFLPIIDPVVPQEGSDFPSFNDRNKMLHYPTGLYDDVLTTTGG